jgi:hypothetical protein
MKNKNKIIKGIAIGLFVVALLLNVSLTFDSGNSQNADLSLGSLKVSLFQQAYAGEGGGSNPACDGGKWWCGYNPNGADYFMSTYSY